jgi:peptidoglycan/LPS O-acetylase OafA/YrhL
MGFRWTNLFISRFFRLVPLYWTCVAVITVIVFINTGQFNSSAFEIIVDILYWLSFFGTPDINNFPLTWIIIAGVTWTLKYEWVFYFSLPFLSIIIRPSTYLKLLMSFIILTTAYYTIRPITISSVDIESQFFSLFFLGALSAYLNQFKFIKKKITSPIFSIIGIGSLAYLLFFFDTSIGYIQYILLYIFFLPVSLGNSMFGLLNKNFSILLGEISYSIYLIHGLILYVTFTILYPNVFENIIVSFRFFSWMVLICLATIIISWLTYILIERTFIKLGKSLQSQVS